MVVPAKRDATKRSEVAPPPLNRPRSEPKRRPAPRPQTGNWAYRLVFSLFLFSVWCLVNGLIMAEMRACNWQKTQASAKEMQVRQLQVKITQRLSELAKNSPQPSSPPILLSLESPKTKPTLLGRR